MQRMNLTMNKLEYEVYNGKIFYFKNVIKNHKEILQYISKNSNPLITEWIPWGNKYATSIEQERDWKSEGVIPEDFGTAKCIYDPSIFDESNLYKDSHWVFKSIDDAIEKCSTIYAEKNNINILENPKLKSSGYVIGRYNSLSVRGPHTDCPYDDLEHSYVIYYNDDYVGGELFFLNHGIKIKPESGSIIMFKSSDLDNEHEALNTDGYKFISPHFWRMGPSQGFVPFGTDIQDHIKEITHDFYNLQIVENNKKNQINES